MTSPPLRPTSAEHSSEVREASTQVEEKRSGIVPPNISPLKDTPLSSLPPSPHVYLAYGSPILSGNATQTTSTLPSPRAHREPTEHLKSPSVPAPHSQVSYPRFTKRPPCNSELRSPKTRRSSHDAHTSSTGARSTPAPRHVSGRARAPASSVGPRTPTQTRESRLAKRLAPRPRKNPPNSKDSRSSTGTRVHDNGDVPTLMLSQTGASVDLQPPLPRNDTYRLPDPRELRSSGPCTSGYREQAGASFPNNAIPFTPSPLLLTSEYPDSSFITGSRSAYPQRPPPSLCRPSTGYSLGSPAKPLASPPSSGLPYGSSGFPILPPAAQILPNMNPSAFRPPPVQSSVEADGYTIIRNAIPLALIRPVVAIIREGLPVSARSDTVQTYMTPLQAYDVRDEFVSNWRPALRPFYDPMGKSIPKMPIINYIASFTASPPTSLSKSLLHIGNKDQIYVHIALTPLTPDTGFFEILRGSHQAKHPARTRVNDWSRTPIALLEGDAIVWRGDVSYLTSSNGGGIFQCMTFEWGPGTVDLTEE